MFIVHAHDNNAGSMCLVPNIAVASPQAVIIRWRKWLSIFLLDFFVIELVISASMMIVFVWGISVLEIVGCVASMCFRKIADCIEFHSLFDWHFWWALFWFKLEFSVVHYCWQSAIQFVNLDLYLICLSLSLVFY